MIPGLAISGGVTSGIGALMQAYGERQGAKATQRSLDRQINQQNAIQADADNNLQRDLFSSDIGNTNDAATYAAARQNSNVNLGPLRMSAAHTMAESAVNDAAHRDSIAARNQAITAGKAARLRQLYGAETDTAGLAGIGPRSLGLVSRGVGRNLMSVGSRYSMPADEPVQGVDASLRKPGTNPYSNLS